MVRFFLCLILLFTINTANAGVYEEALKTNERVFLYIYTKKCGYCVKFNPIYEMLAKKYGAQCKFVKVDGNSSYGEDLIRAFGTRFVPYVVIVNSKKGQSALIPPNCLLHISCSDEIMRSFVK